MGKLKPIRKKKFIAQGGCCYYCGLPMWEGNVDRALPKTCRGVQRHLRCTAGHLLPRCKGGADSPDNIVAACLYCNRTRHRGKHPKPPEVYRAHVRGRMAAGRWLAGQIASGLGAKGVGVTPDLRRR